MKALVAALALFAFSEVNAGIIYDFSGVVDRLETGPTARDGITLGSEFSGWLEFDPDSFLLGSGQIYQRGIVGYAFEMGDYAYRSQSTWMSYSPFDPNGQIFRDETPVSSDPALLYAEVTYWVFEGLDSPLPGDLDHFDFGQLFLQVWTRGADGRIVGASNAYGEFLQWNRRASVPEPETVGLLGVALLGVAFVRRARRDAGSA